jgi:hypothetical protein
MPTSIHKPWYQSITIWAGIVQLISGAGLTGLNLDVATGDFTGNIYELWASLSPMATGALTIWGRWRAKFAVA